MLFLRLSMTWLTASPRLSKQKQLLTTNAKPLSNQTWPVPIWPRKKQASGPVPMPSTLSMEKKFLSGLPTMS